jgi:hypothetical protein
MLLKTTSTDGLVPREQQGSVILSTHDNTLYCHNDKNAAEYYQKLLTHTHNVHSQSSTSTLDLDRERASKPTLEYASM